MSFFTVDEATCTRCGICLDECPAGGIIEMKSESDVPTPTEAAEQRCIACGHCVSVCPFGSFSLSAIPVNECLPIDRELLPNGAEVDHLMLARRSIRRYKDEAVDRDVITQLIDTASHAPSGHNSQNVKWLVIHDSERVKRISQITIDWLRHMVKEKHPAAEKFAARQLVAAWRAGINPICREAPHLIFAHAPKDYPGGTTNCTIALTYLELAASAHELGACWAGFVMACYAFWPPMKEELALPEEQEMYGAMMLGRPKYKYYHVPKRKDPEVIWG